MQDLTVQLGEEARAAIDALEEPDSRCTGCRSELRELIQETGRRRGELKPRRGRSKGRKSIDQARLAPMALRPTCQIVNLSARSCRALTESSDAEELANIVETALRWRWFWRPRRGDADTVTQIAAELSVCPFRGDEAPRFPLEGGDRPGGSECARWRGELCD
jgi:hypothetical protein